MPEPAVPSTRVIHLHTRLRGLTARRIARACLLALALFGSLFASAREGHASLQRDALWQVVSQVCIAGQRNSGTPFPCSSVDLQVGYAVLPITRTHILLVPTVPIRGIESPALTKSDSPNYWEIAWDQRSRLGQAIGAKVSRDDVALAVNSLQARTQDQLHIHISCVRPDVRSALKRYEADIGEGWSRLPFAIAGDLYRARRLYGDTIDANPFELLAKGLPEAPARHGQPDIGGRRSHVSRWAERVLSADPTQRGPQACRRGASPRLPLCIVAKDELIEGEVLGGAHRTKAPQSSRQIVQR